MIRAIPIAILAAVLATHSAFACATVVFPQEKLAWAMGEKTLIAWDADKKIEHFVRSVTFDIASKSLGFIVPTPNKPEIASVDEEAFDRLRGYVDAKLYEFDREPQTKGGLLMTAGIEQGGVQVLERAEIAGMDVAVLKAGDAASLTDWLRQNNFDARLGLLEWSKPYIKKKWVFTAFKYLRPNKSSGSRHDDSDLWKATTDGHVPQLETKVVRLSFVAPRPIYPYREPNDAHLKHRTFVLYVLAPVSVTAALDDQAVAASEWNWSLTPAPSVPVDEEISKALAKILPSGGDWRNTRITRFKDFHLDRPDADVVFESR